MVVLPLSSYAPQQWHLASLAGLGFFPYSVGVHHTSAPSGCLHIANPSPFPRSDLQSPSLSTQRPPAQTQERLRLGSAGLWHQPSVQVSLCFPLCELVAVLFSEASKLPPATLSWLISPPVRGLPSVWKSFLFHSSLPGVQVLS